MFGYLIQPFILHFDLACTFFFRLPRKAFAGIEAPRRVGVISSPNILAVIDDQLFHSVK